MECRKRTHNVLLTFRTSSESAVGGFWVDYMGFWVDLIAFDSFFDSSSLILLLLG